MRDNQFGGRLGPQMPMGPQGMRPQMGGGMPGGMGSPPPNMMSLPSPFGGPMMSPPMGRGPMGPGVGGGQPICICTPCKYINSSKPELCRK
jgi:hypothetical protein